MSDRPQYGEFPLRDVGEIRTQPLLGTFLSDSRSAPALPTSSVPGSGTGSHLLPTEALTVSNDGAAQPQWAHIESSARNQERDDDQGTVDEDGGVIRCICDCDDDDGFTIQCDRCLVWQHCACFGMSQDSVPDEYLCDQCDPRPVDIAFAQAHQKLRKEEETRKEEESRRAAQIERITSRRQSLGPASSSRPDDGNAQSLHFDSLSVDSDVRTTNVVAPSTEVTTSSSRSRKASQSHDASAAAEASESGPSSVVTAKTGRRKSGKNAVKRSAEGGAPANVAKRPFSPTANASRDDRLENEARPSLEATEKAEAWHLEFTSVERNIVVESSALESLAAAMLNWEEGSPLQAAVHPSGVHVAPIAPQQLIRPARCLDDNSQITSVAPPTPPLVLEGGLSAIGNECVPIELSAPKSLAELGCSTYVKMISESASSAIFSNTTPIPPLPSEPQRPWAASRSFSRPVMHGLFAEAHVSAGSFIGEYCGELLSAQTYRDSPINQYPTLGVVKPHVHVFPPPFNLAIDARRFGRDTRFARSSCHPNAVLRPILFRRLPSYGATARAPRSGREASTSKGSAAGAKSAQSDPTEAELLFGIFAIAEIPRTHEITLGWEWDDEHIVHFLPELVSNPYVLPPREHNSTTVAATYAEEDDTPDKRHTAALIAFAEKGQYPYAGTLFSAKINSFVTSLLGCTLCACIGSAAPPGGSASANNGRKQDCVVAQMLRVGYGMPLHNVATPGNKTNRRVRLPDFHPLVGVRRWWRPLSMPDSPEASRCDTDGLEFAELISRTFRKRLATGPLERVSESDYLSVIRRAESQMKASTLLAKSESMDVDSDASSLTDALPGLSELEDDDLDDSELISVLRHVRPDENGYDGPLILPLKKRVSGTRIKAARSDEESEEAVARRAALHIAVTGKRKRRLSKVTGVLFDIGSDRHAQQRKSRLHALHQRRRSEITSASTQYSSRAHRRFKKQRISSGMPSSPLTSLPSGGSRSSLSPAPEADLDESESENINDDLEEADLTGDAEEDSEIEGDEDDTFDSESLLKRNAVLRKARQTYKRKGPAPPTSSTWEATHSKTLSQNKADLDDTESHSESDDALRNGRVSHSKPRGQLRERNREQLRQHDRRRRADSSEQGDADSSHGGSISGSSETDERGKARLRFSRIPRAQTPGAVQVDADDVRTEHPPSRETAEDIAPPPIPQPEPPRATLSLADYKKRLAQRRTQELTKLNEVASDSSPLVSLPTSTGSVELKVDTHSHGIPSQGFSAHSSTPTNSQPIQGGALFASISAPVALRSVDIPKSPPTHSRSIVSNSTSPKRAHSVFKDSPVASSVNDSFTNLQLHRDRGASFSGNLEPLSAAFGRTSTAASSVTRLPPPHMSSANASSQVATAGRSLNDTSSVSPATPVGSQWGPKGSSITSFDTPSTRIVGVGLPSSNQQNPARSMSGFRPVGEMTTGRNPLLTGATSATTGSGGFNPPRGPRALLNASATGAGSQTAATTSMSPSVQRPAMPRMGSQASTPSGTGRAGSMSSDGGGSAGTVVGSSPPIREGLTIGRQPPVPRNGDRDFAGIPKGPARMGETPPMGSHSSMRSISPDGRPPLPLPSARLSETLGPPPSNASWGERVPPQQRSASGSVGGGSDSRMERSRGYGSMSSEGGRSDGGRNGTSGWGGAMSRGWGARVRGSRGGGRGRDKWQR